MTHSSARMARYSIVCCIGTGRDAPNALIELRLKFCAEQEETKRAMIAELAPKKDEPNSFADCMGQIWQDSIIFAKRERSFAMAGNKTVQIKATVALYDREIKTSCTLLSGMLKNGLTSV